MLDLLQPFDAVTDPVRGLQHIVNLDASAGPPWSGLCGIQLQVSRQTFRSRLTDDRPRCSTCEWLYRERVNPGAQAQRLRTSRPAPPRG
jgi:hypothetical protein